LPEFDRREVVVLTGETVEHGEQKLLPIIRTDAGGFFGFGERDGPKFNNFEGRFAQLLPPKRPTAEPGSWPVRCLRRWGSARMRCATTLSRIDPFYSLG
jgi:hypothetical protein